MQTYENYRGVRHRTLVLMYIVWLTVSLAPAMYAPPERSLPKGQPELQQAMDNMVTRETVIQKRMGISSGDESHYQELNFRTSKLLADAENVLSHLPDSKERQWVESFIGRMREIATMLEKLAQQKNLAKDSDALKSTPVPEGLPKQPTWPAASAVPEINPFQKPLSSMSKVQMTSEISRVLPVNDDHAEHQAVTKPVALSRKVEESESDELVRELENLHDENTRKTHTNDSKVVNQALNVTTRSSPSSLGSNHATPLNDMAEKSNLKAKLIEEIEEFHRLGGVMPKEIIDILYTDSHKLTDPVQNRNINVDEEMKFTESGMTDRRGMLRMDDVHNEEKEITMVNSENTPHYPGKQFQYMKYNHEFQNKHPNMVQAFPKQTGHYFQNVYPFNVAQPYQGHPQNTNQNLLKIDPYNQEKYRDLGMQPQSGQIPDALHQKFSKSHIYYNGRMPAANYNNYFMRRNYGPYPYIHNWNPQNSTNHLPQMMPPRVPANQAKIDTQLSDEMKRELRDGKIIVLSDSVVRTNFDADKDKTTQSMTEKPESHQMDMKNETITEN